MLKALNTHQDIIVYVVDEAIAQMFLDNLLASIHALLTQLLDRYFWCIN
jgi:hypothetical protein